MFGKDLGVANKIKTIEALRCNLLADVSTFFMVSQQAQSAENMADALAEIELTLRLLGEQMGVSATQLEERTMAKLKLRLIEEEGMQGKSALLNVLHGLEQTL